jgi:hypothetical protein
MKKIIIHLVIFITAIMLVDRMGAYLFTRFIFSNTMSGDSGGGVNYLLQKKKNIDFVILGSSRARHHIDPSLLTNVYNGNGYNAGIDGTGGIAYNAMLLHLMIEHNNHPKLVIIQIDPYPYFADGDENITNELLPLYPFLNNSKSLSEFIYEQIDYSKKFKLFFHSYRYNGKFLRVLYNYNKRNAVENNNGFEALNGTIDSTSFKKQTTLNSNRYASIKLKALLDIIQTSKKNNITLAVVFPPTYNNNAFNKPVTDYITSLLKQNGVKNIFDFADIEKIPALEHASLWKDAGHLNKNGAAIFSARLNDTMREMK